jgi:hypothetical protein
VPPKVALDGSLRVFLMCALMTVCESLPSFSRGLSEGGTQRTTGAAQSGLAVLAGVQHLADHMRSSLSRRSTGPLLARSILTRLRAQRQHGLNRERSIAGRDGVLST